MPEKSMPSMLITWFSEGLILVSLGGTKLFALTTSFSDLLLPRRHGLQTGV